MSVIVSSERAAGMARKVRLLWERYWMPAGSHSHLLTLPEP